MGQSVGGGWGFAPGLSCLSLARLAGPRCPLGGYGGLWLSGSGGGGGGGVSTFGVWGPLQVSACGARRTPTCVECSVPPRRQGLRRWLCRPTQGVSAMEGGGREAPIHSYL